jgi:hypothetical protein
VQPATCFSAPAITQASSPTGSVAVWCPNHPRDRVG